MAELKIRENGYTVEFLHNKRESEHYHVEVELLYVLSGKCEVHTEGKEWDLVKEDILVLGTGRSHSIVTEEEDLTLRIRFSFEILSEAISDGNYVFTCNSLQQNKPEFESLRAILRRVVFTVIERYRQGNSSENHAGDAGCLLRGLMYEVLDVLQRSFREKSRQGLENASKEEQIDAVVSYINMNFQSPIRIREVADRLYISSSTLSRLFKSRTGVYFADYIEDVRLMNAASQLTETDKKVTRISMDCGFSNPSVFSRSFQAKYSMSPTEYRKAGQEEKLAEKETDPVEVERITQMLGDFSAQSAASMSGMSGVPGIGGIIGSEEQLEIRVPSEQDSDLPESPRFWSCVVNAGSAYGLMQANIQNHLLFLKKELHFRYVRFWNIFSDQMMIRSGIDDRQYNFEMIDLALDFLVEHDMVPFIDLGYRPETAVSQPGQTVFYRDDSIGYRTIEDWERLFRAFVDHVLRRYRTEQTGQWIFEFSKDPRGASGQIRAEYDFGELYRNCHMYVKEHLQGAKIGGISAAVDSGNEELYHWLEDLRAHALTPDFVSILSFPYRSVEGKMEGESDSRRYAGDGWDVDQIRTVRRNLDRDGLSQVPIYVTEWNSFLSTRNFLNDSCYRAADFLHSAQKLWGLPESMGIWMSTDLVSRYVDTRRIANGGNGMVTRDGIPKPIFFAVCFLERMQGRVVLCGEHFFASRTASGSCYLLCFNRKALSARFQMAQEGHIRPRDLEQMVENERPIRLCFEIPGVEPLCEYVVKERLVSPRTRSLLAEWEKLGFEEELTGPDTKYLRDVCTPELHMEKTASDQEGTLRVETELGANEIALFHIYRR